MTINDYLEIRNRERHDLLLQIADVLKRDHRVRAAWLTGSVSRGDDDGLSDLDLMIVVSDEGAFDFVRNRRKFASQPADAVLTMDNFRNAPPGGAYLLTLYAGEVGPQHVDWFWQPESYAQIPDDEKVLFDHIGLHKIPGAEWRRAQHRPIAQPLPEHSTLTDVLTHKIAFFWAMSVITAKYIARQDSKKAAEMMTRIARTLYETAHLASLPIPDHAETIDTTFEAETPSRQSNALLELSGDAKWLHDGLTERGAAIPSEAIPHIYRFYELTSSMAMSR